MNHSANILMGLLIALSLSACDHSKDSVLQGYVEGEFVYVSSPFGGKLEALHVSRGAQVARGAALFDLDDAPARAQRAAAIAQYEQAQASVRDVRKGQRPTEIDALQAQYQQAVAGLSFAESELLRQQKLFASGNVTSRQEVDRAETQRDQARDQLATLSAQLKTARLGARADQVSAAEANRDAMQAQVANADWTLAQMRQSATIDALVADTLYREGEWVAAGRPVVALLPPTNIKVRAFVSEQQLGALAIGNPVTITVDGRAQSIDGKIAFISPQMEFTPPVLYSKENRSKLVAMVEIVFDPTIAATLHPGQPVDVLFPQSR